MEENIMMMEVNEENDDGGLDIMNNGGLDINDEGGLDKMDGLEDQSQKMICPVQDPDPDDFE